MIHDTLTAATRNIRTAKATPAGRQAAGEQAAPGSGPAARVDISDAARARAAKHSDPVRKPAAKYSDPSFKPILWSAKLWMRYPSGVSGNKPTPKPKRPAPQTVRPAPTQPRKGHRAATATVLKRKAVSAGTKSNSAVETSATQAAKKSDVTQRPLAKKAASEMKVGFKDTPSGVKKNVRFSKAGGRSQAVRVRA